jgi:hypothetical protein
MSKAERRQAQEARGICHWRDVEGTMVPWKEVSMYTQLNLEKLCELQWMVHSL